MTTDLAAAVGFASADEFREIFDRTFQAASDDEALGPQLRAAGIPQRLEFPDLGLVFNARAGREGEPNLHWVWSDAIDWTPQVGLTMDSEVANRYFQGKENFALAVARRRIRAGGEVKAALAILQLQRPVFAHYRRLVASDYPHLEA